MAFRKLQFKHVEDTRSTQVIGHGELAVDETTNQLFIGDGATAGGQSVIAPSRFADAVSTQTTTTVLGSSPELPVNSDLIPERHTASSTVLNGKLRIPDLSDDEFGKEIVISGSGSNAMQLNFTGSTGASTQSLGTTSIQLARWWGTFWKTEQIT